MGKEGGWGVWDGRERARRSAGYMVICMKMLIIIGGYWSVVKFLPQLAVMLQSD